MRAERIRELLSRVQRLVPRLLAERTPVVQALGNDVLTYYPAENASGGRGALFSSFTLLELIREYRGAPGTALASVLDDGTIGPVDPNAVSAIPFVAIHPRASAETDRTPWLLAALAGLGVFLLLGVVLTLRALQKERLAARARAEFLSAVTHEIKTPLASIRLLADVLQSRQANAERSRRYHQRLASESARLTLLVENVLDLGRLERGERALDLRDEDLRDVAQEAVAVYEPLADRDGLAVRLSVPDVACPARVDRGALLQVLLNLLENARRYAADGARVDVQLSASAEEFRLIVRDYGPGIAPGDAERIFERFQRGHEAEHGGNPGVGLGLFLSRALARAHGGELRCQAPDDAGSGAQFVLTIPAYRAPAGSVPLVDTSPGEVGVNPT